MCAYQLGNNVWAVSPCRVPAHPKIPLKSFQPKFGQFASTLKAVSEAS